MKRENHNNDAVLREFTKNGFEYCIRTTLDTHASPDDTLGSYSDVAGLGAIECPAVTQRYGRTRYFNPANYDPHNEHRDVYARAAFERIENLRRGYWYYIGLLCTIRKQTATGWAKPTVFGRSSCWGVESDCAEGHLNGLCTELIVDAEMDLMNNRDALLSLPAKGGL